MSLLITVLVLIWLISYIYILHFYFKDFRDSCTYSAGKVGYRLFTIFEHIVFFFQFKLHISVYRLHVDVPA